MITFSDNTEVAYLKTLSKEDIIKFYKVNWICTFRFLADKEIVNVLCCVLLLWIHSGMICESIFMDVSILDTYYYWKEQVQFILNAVLFSSPSGPGTWWPFQAYFCFFSLFTTPPLQWTLLSLFCGRKNRELLLES